MSIPEAVAGVAASRRRIAGREDGLRVAFHEALADLMPEAAVLRTPDGERAAQLLAESALAAADAFAAGRPAEEAEQIVVEAGVHVHRLGFPDAGYQAVGHALLRGVRAVHAGEWSGALSSQWVGYYDWLRGLWLRGAGVARLLDGAAADPFPHTGEQPAVDVTGAARDDLVDLDDLEDLDDEDEGLSYGELMVSMTRRPKPR